MSAVLQGTDDWHLLRVGMITGSRVAGILGESPFTKRADVMRESVRSALGAESEFTGNAATQWGNEHEPDARALFTAMTGIEVKEEAFKVHPDYDFIGVSPDGLTDQGGIEFKCPYSQKIPKELPRHYWIQVQLCMEVYNVDSWPVFYWTPDDVKLFPVVRDKAWFNEILPELQAFHDEYLKELENPAHLEPLVTERTDEVWADAAENYLAICKTLKTLEDQKKEAHARLVELADDHSCKGAGVIVSKCERQGAVNNKAIYAEFGVDPEKFRGKPSTYFQIRESK